MREIVHIPGGVQYKFSPYPARGTVGVYRKVDPTKSSYITFDPDGMSKNTWRQTVGPGLETIKDTRVHTLS